MIQGLRTAEEVDHVEEDVNRERVRGYDRARRVLGYHVNRLNRRAKKYERNPAQEERYFRTLKALGYLMQTYIGAQRVRFEEEMDLVDELLESVDAKREDHERLRRLEAEYLKVVGNQR